MQSSAPEADLSDGMWRSKDLFEDPMLVLTGTIPQQK